MPFFTSHRPSERTASAAGQAALSTIFIIGGIAVFAALTMAFLALSFLNATASVQAGNRAEEVAAAGLNDALMKLARNWSYATTSFTVPVDIYTATVQITNTTSTGQVTILSTGVVSNNIRKIQAVATIVTSTGEVTLQNWVLIP